MLDAAVQNLLDAAHCDTTMDAELNAAAQAFFDAVRGSTKQEATSAITTIASSFATVAPAHAALLALVCGSLVESGLNPMAIADPLTKELEILLVASVKLFRHCYQPSDEEDRDSKESFEISRAASASIMPEEHAAWVALEKFWCPCVAVYSRSPEARASAKHLRSAAQEISEVHEAGHWLQLLLSVLDDEPIVVIEPRNQLGILARISGVVDNFQLNVLLMDAFPRTGFFSKRRVSERVAAIARGEGPQTSDDIVTGVWNLYTWQAVDKNLKLPEAMDSSAWIWNEGIPEDIPVLDGRRVIVLGPASYSRTWRSQRMFEGLPAKFEVERKLSTKEVNEWLLRMV